MVTTVDSRDEILEQLMCEFFESCEDQIDALNDNLDALFQDSSTPEAQLSEIRRAAHNLKGLGTTFGFPLISIIAHRLEDYLGRSNNIGLKEIEDAQIFVDRIRDILVTREQPSEEASSEIVRTLPARSSAPEKTIEKADKKIEVMAIMPHSVQQKLIEEELQEKGYRVTNVESSFQAIEMVVLSQPDLILVSALIDKLDGRELAHIFRSIDSTVDIPIILVTSFSDDDKHIPKDLPSKTRIVHKGQNFRDELEACVEEFGFHN